MKYIRIYVGAKDIVAGEPRKPNACPIAHAIKRVTKTKRPRVDGITCRVVHKGKSLLFALPKTAKNFVANFDLACRVRPFSFRLTPKLRVQE